MFLIIPVALTAFKPGALVLAGHWTAQGAYFPLGLPAAAPRRTATACFARG